MIAESSIAQLGQYVARKEESFVHDLREHARLRAALVFAAERSRPPRHVIRRHAAGALLAGVVVLAVILFAPRSESRIAFVVGEPGAEGVVGRFIAATEAPLPVTFSDGTQVTLEQGATGRIPSTTSAGADIVVESGRAAVAIVSRPGDRWQVSAGPFVVDVTGARFHVEWYPERDAFELELEEGRVRISGCAFHDGRAVRAGKRVEASCARGEFRVSQLESRSEAARAAPNDGQTQLN